MQEYPVFTTGTSITSQHYSGYKVPSEVERLRGGRENKVSTKISSSTNCHGKERNEFSFEQNKQSSSGIILNSNKSLNESFQSSGMETLNQVLI